jgi:hypothetical protein
MAGLKWPNKIPAVMASNTQKVRLEKSLFIMNDFYKVALGYFFSILLLK